MGGLLDALRLREGSPFSLIVGARVLGGATLIEAARRVQGALARLGVEPRTVIAFVARLDEPTLLLTVAALDAGISFLPLHPRASASEHEHLIRAASAVVVESTELDLGHLVDPGWLARMADAARQPRATAALVATSGTSGEPKLAVLSRKAFVVSADASTAHLGLRSDDRWLMGLPFAHVGGLSILTRGLVAGRRVVVHRGFEPEAVLDSLARHDVTLISVVPSMLEPLFSVDTRGLLSRLRVLLVGGAHCARELRREAIARSLPLITTYGLTEACSQVTAQRPGTVNVPGGLDSGHPLPGVEVRVVDGVIQVRTPALMSGYHGDAPRSCDEFFSTGDCGEIDASGRLIVSGRSDDVVITGGENVHPEAVERVLRAQPGVRDAIVFGVPHPRLGQQVAALLVPEPGHPPLAVMERARRGAAAALAGFALPRAVACVGAVPLNALGKPDRRRAREEHASALEPWEQ